MASLTADIAAAKAGVPPTRVATNVLHGRIRQFEATITVTGAPIAIGETITWGTLPHGCRPLGNLGKLYFSVGTAASTINLGDVVNPTRHLAATSIAAAGSAIPEAANANGASFAVTSNTGATDDGTLISVVAGAAIPLGQVLKLRMPYVMD